MIPPVIVTMTAIMIAAMIAVVTITDGVNIYLRKEVYNHAERICKRVDSDEPNELYGLSK